jgi:hypothetical protein
LTTSDASSFPYCGVWRRQRGEPIRTLLSPTGAEALLTRCGLSVIDHLDRDALRERYLAGRDDVPPPYTTERVITAAVPR